MVSLLKIKIYMQRLYKNSESYTMILKRILYFGPEVNGL